MNFRPSRSTVNILLARYLRVSLAIASTKIGGQSAEVRGGRGSDFS
jgi:hypothetical protein